MNELNFNIYNILIAAGIIHGIVFAIILLYKKKNWKTFRLFLAFSVFALAFNNLQYWFRDTQLNIDYPWLTAIYIQFELLVGPFFYLFVQKYLGKHLKKSIILLVLSPFILSSISFPLFSRGLFSVSFEEIFNQALEFFTIGLNIWLVCYIFYAIIKLNDMRIAVAHQGFLRANIEADHSCSHEGFHPTVKFDFFHIGSYPID